jgi:hypothetical protein
VLSRSTVSISGKSIRRAYFIATNRCIVVAVYCEIEYRRIASVSRLRIGNPYRSRGQLGPSVEIVGPEAPLDISRRCVL